MILKLDKFRKANFFSGLKASPSFWNNMQSYHFDKENLYNQIFHGAGVVPEVMDELKISELHRKGDSLTVNIGKGMTIDGHGRPVFIYDSVVRVIDYKRYKLPLTIYITVKYNEFQEDFFQDDSNPDVQGYQKKLESGLIEISEKEPDNILIMELARIDLAKNDSGVIIKDLKKGTYCNTGLNELDDRYKLWSTCTKKRLSTKLKEYTVKNLETTRNVAVAGYDDVSLTSLRELQTVSLTAKMLVQCGDVGFDDMINILYPIYEIYNNVIQEMLEYERKEEKRIFSSKDSFTDFRTNVYEMGDAIKYFDGKVESLDKVLLSQDLIVVAIRNIFVSKRITLHDIGLISYELPRILIVGDERYTLVDYIDFADKQSEDDHELTVVDCKDFTTSNNAYSYPDGVVVRDAVKRYVGGSVSFKIKNLVKRRKTIIIRRTDIFRGDYTVDVNVGNLADLHMSIDGSDSENRWRNIPLVINDNLIKANSTKLTFKMSDSGRDNIGKIWVYQII